MALLVVIGCLSMASVALGLGLDLTAMDSYEKGEEEGRVFLPVLLSGLGGPNPNITILAALLAGLSSSLLSLFTLAGLGILAASKNDKDDKHHHTIHHYRRMVDITDWESISFMEWLKIVQDMWRNFDPMDSECQKLFICDLHQSRAELGPMADTLIYYFSYLEYGEVLRLPEAFKNSLKEFMDAASSGNYESPSCGDIYSDCNFSVKDFVKKYEHPQLPSNIDDNKEPSQTKGDDLRYNGDQNNHPRNPALKYSSNHDKEGENGNNPILNIHSNIYNPTLNRQNSKYNPIFNSQNKDTNNPISNSRNKGRSPPNIGRLNSSKQQLIKNTNHLTFLFKRNHI